MKKIKELIVHSRTLRCDQRNLTIKYGFGVTPFGKIIIACLKEDNNAICHLHFVNENNEDRSLLCLKNKWPEATFIEDTEMATQIASRILLECNEPEAIEVVVKGTTFQNLVWSALLKIPRGSTKTYSEVAEMIGRPASVRAVANAVASNEISLLIPCHRVVSKDSSKVKYGWGPECKLNILNFEKC